MKKCFRGTISLVIYAINLIYLPHDSMLPAALCFKYSQDIDLEKFDKKSTYISSVLHE